MPKIKNKLSRSSVKNRSTNQQSTITSFFQSSQNNQQKSGNFKTLSQTSDLTNKSSSGIYSKHFPSKGKEIEKSDEAVILTEELSTCSKEFADSEVKENDCGDKTERLCYIEAIEEKAEISCLGSTSKAKKMDNEILQSLQLEPSTHKTMDNSMYSGTYNLFSEDPEQQENAHMDSEDDGSYSSEQYYHKHFLHAMDSVLMDSQNQVLLNDYDKKIVNVFKSLTEQEQNLYIRIFGRKLRWLRQSKLSYPEISQDLSPFLMRLVYCGLLQDEKDLVELEELLRLLMMPELKHLCKYFGVGSGAKGKQQIIDAFLQHCRQQATINHFFNTASIEKKVVHKIKEIVGRCYKIQSDPRKVFVRLLLLFSLTDLAEEEEDAACGGQQRKLVTLIMVQKGHLNFPQYEIIKNLPVFPDRDSLLRYESAKQMEMDIQNFFNERRYDEAYELYLSARHYYIEACSSGQAYNDCKHPIFLQRYTSTYIYIRCMNHGVEVLQKLKKYQEAVDLLWLLLYQQFHCQMYRGHWWDRLTMILDFHMKNIELTLEALNQAFIDQNLRPAHEHSLSKRAQKIIELLKKKNDAKEGLMTRRKLRKNKRKEIAILHTAMQRGLRFDEAPKVTISGRQLPGSQAGFKSVFVLPTPGVPETEGVSLLTVEELALDHYRQQGYIQGIHGEGATIISIFALLFWDIIYGGSIPDVYRGPYQTWPLDLNTDAFYASRKTRIDSLISAIRKSSKEDLQATAEACWEKYVGTTSLVSWGLFKGSYQIKELVRAFTSTALAGICERLAKDFRHCRSGFPDLIVWNPLSEELKVVEVKGPQDKLSSKQVVWLHCLLKMKVPVEVCHVNAVGIKRLKI